MMKGVRVVLCLIEKLNNKSGALLIVVLWMLVILSLLTIGLARRSQLELVLTKHALGKLRSKAAAFSGLAYAVNLIKQDAIDEKGKRTDSKYACGFTLGDDEIPEDIFRHVPVGDQHFEFSFLNKKKEGASRLQYGN